VAIENTVHFCALWYLLLYTKYPTFRFLWPCIMSKLWRERENQQDATIRCLLSTSVPAYFGHHYAHFQENKDRVLLHAVCCFVGCLHPTTQRPTTATNHIQQNQRSTPHAVTHGLCSPEDGHNDDRNMLRQKLIINIWLLLLGGFSLSLHNPSFNLNVLCPDTVCKRKKLHPWIFFTFVPCILLLTKFFLLPTDAQENCFEKEY